MYTDMDNWAEIRRRVLADGLSGRAACREYKIHWKTLKKILDNPEPPDNFGERIAFLATAAAERLAAGEGAA